MFIGIGCFEEKKLPRFLVGFPNFSRQHLISGRDPPPFCTLYLVGTVHQNENIGFLIEKKKYNTYIIRDSGVKMQLDGEALDGCL